MLKRNLKFGVEIEFFGATREEVARKLREKNIEARVEGYNHVTQEHWKLVTDSSVNPRGCGNMNDHGNEIVSPILYGIEGLKELETVCNTLEEVGAKVDRTCGIHVHHDITDMNIEQIKNIFKIYNKYNNYIENIMPRSRRAEARNTYCQPFSEREKEVMYNATTLQEMKQGLVDRFKTVNFTSYTKYGTLEFRQHSGTVEYEKIKAWVLTTAKMIDKAKDKKKVNPIKSEQERQELKRIEQRFFKELEIEGEEFMVIREYWKERRKKFQEEKREREARRATRR